MLPPHVSLLLSKKLLCRLSPKQTLRWKESAWLWWSLKKSYHSFSSSVINTTFICSSQKLLHFINYANVLYILWKLRWTSSRFMCSSWGLKGLISMSLVGHLDTFWQENSLKCSSILKNVLAKISQGLFSQLHIAHLARKKTVGCVSLKNVNCLEPGPIGLPRNINLGLRY